MPTPRGEDGVVPGQGEEPEVQRPAWIPVVRFDELRRQAFEAAEQEHRRREFQRSRGLRMSGTVAVIIGVASFATALWYKDGGLVIAMTALLVLAGIAAMRPRAPQMADVQQSVGKHFAIALEHYRRDQLNAPDFYHSEGWQALRRSVLERKNARCRRCGRKASAMLVVEHIVPRYEAPELALDPTNVEVLCHACRNIHTFVLPTGAA